MLTHLVGHFLGNMTHNMSHYEHGFREHPVGLCLGLFMPPSGRAIDMWHNMCHI